MARQPTGRNEQGMLADIKPVAESVGRDILGFAIDWQAPRCHRPPGRRQP